MEIINDLGLPQVFVDAVANDPYSGKNTGRYISVTSLIAPPQQTLLKRRHWDQIQERASLRVWSLIGQTAHVILERAAEARWDCVTEVRVSRSFAGWIVNGQFDLLEVGPRLLTDFKVTSVWATREGAKDEWRMQASVLAWLMNHAGYPVEQAQILAIYRDWSAMKARFDRTDYPAAPAQVFPIELMPAREVEAFVRERLAELSAAEIRPCTDKEKWQRPERWAVMKGENKRASRITDSSEAAYEWIAQQKDPSKYRVEARQSDPVRCLDYCSVAAFCQQHQGEYHVPEENGDG